GHHHLCYRLVEVDLAGSVSCPTLEGAAVGGNQAAGGVEAEAAGTGVELLATLLDDEEAVALDGDVGGAAGRLRRALVEQGGDGADLHAEADLGRVGATGTAAGGR